jgi:hypothetical protein
MCTVVIVSVGEPLVAGVYSSHAVLAFVVLLKFPVVCVTVCLGSLYRVRNLRAGCVILGFGTLLMLLQSALP